MVNTYTVPCLLIYSGQKRHFYLTVTTLTSKNISRTFFVVCLPLNTFFLPFTCILTCRYINQFHPVWVYTLNTQSTGYSLVLTAANVPLIFHAVVWPSKHQPYLCSNLESSEYARRYLVRCLFSSKQVICAVFWHFNL